MLRKVITYITYSVLIALIVLCLVAVALRPSSGQAQAAGGNINAVDKWAWGTNVGWINFNPTHSQVTVDYATGSFDGYAWGENIGWIHFKGTGAVAYGVVWSHTLTVSINTTDGGSGRVSSAPAGIFCAEDCTEEYGHGTAVALRSHPGVKSYVTWGGDCDANGQVTMDDDKTCTATFSYPIGGVVVPVDKLGLAAPWIGMVALAGLAALRVVVVRKRGGS